MTAPPAGASGQAGGSALSSQDQGGGRRYPAHPMAALTPHAERKIAFPEHRQALGPGPPGQLVVQASLRVEGLVDVLQDAGLEAPARADAPDWLGVPGADRRADHAEGLGAAVV